ncbi:hypothetical protein [Nonomuraea helvata]|uniref:Uncharacterized protein n=1 Tax=Nonomuraea helvata TaxID=37484 RepID=A0ABV5RVW8_9ACTN
MTVTWRELSNRYPGWQINDMAGGWVAMRKILVPQENALSNVRCGETLDELASNLESESRLEAKKQPKRLRGAA